MKHFHGHGAAAGHAAGRIAFPHLGELLVSGGVLPADAVGRVMARQRELGVPFGEAAVDLGLVSQADVLVALAHQFDYPVLPAGDQGVSPELVAAFEPNSERVEALRQLRSQLVLRRAANPQLNTVAVVGAGRSEGRSWLAANLAVLFSQLGERTLLIGCDLRFPRQQSLFRLAPAGGLAWPSGARRGRSCPTRALRSCRCCRPASCRPTPRSCWPAVPSGRRWRWPATPST